VLADAKRRVLAITDKTELVPFGEHLPLGERFPSLYDLVPGAGHLTKGRTAALELGTTRIGALVCYEDILTGRVRELVLATRPNVLVNLTNDAWFRASESPTDAETSTRWRTTFDAAHVHFALATLRSIEHRLSLVRATNDGVSAVIAPDGTVERTLVEAAPRAEVIPVRLMSATLTFYGRFGDTPIGMLIGAGLLAALARRRAASPAGVQPGRQ